MNKKICCEIFICVFCVCTYTCIWDCVKTINKEYNKIEIQITFNSKSAKTKFITCE